MTVEEAFREMKGREWGFARSKSGMVAVGPLRFGVVEVYAMDTDPVRAVIKAVEHEQQIKEKIK